MPVSDISAFQKWRWSPHIKKKFCLSAMLFIPSVGKHKVKTWGGLQWRGVYQILSNSVQKFSYSIKSTHKSLQQKISPFKSEYTDGHKMSWIYGTDSFNTTSINAYSKPIESTKNVRSSYFRMHFNIILPSMSTLPKNFSTAKNDISHCTGVRHSGFIIIIKRSTDRDQVPHPSMNHVFSRHRNLKNCFQVLEF